jgi:hypothetical protein
MIVCVFIIKEVLPGVIAFEMTPDQSKGTPLELRAATRLDKIVADGLKAAMQESGSGTMVEIKPKGPNQ